LIKDTGILTSCEASARQEELLCPEHGSSFAQESCNASEFAVSEDNLASTKIYKGITIITIKDTQSNFMDTELHRNASDVTTL
jgi:hypothetical protein